MPAVPIEYRDDLGGISPSMLTGFFVGWPTSPAPAVLLKILEGSFARQVAFDAKAARAIGFAYAVSDGVLAAYIPLLEVLPEYQGRGIGSELIRRLVNQLTGLYMIDLVCDPELEAFYRPLGFSPRCGMIRRNYAAQRGIEAE